ncbi:MAG TPA: serine hydrolase [Gemmatimonadaceae bacterium]|nr:serine hydrolase [Gemmatimonadaceae bacterium]
MLRIVVTVLGLTAASDGLPAKKPAAVGMSANRLESVERIVTRGIDAGGYPGAAVVVGRRGGVVLQRGFGRLSWGAESNTVSPDTTIYDIASLTKVVGTTAAIMALYDDGKIQLDAPVTRYLPQFTGGLNDMVTVQDLLTHRSGLPAARDLWRVADTPDAARTMVLTTRVRDIPGRKYLYSDLGADVLGFIVEAVAQQPLDVFLHNRVYGPLRMHNTFFRPADSLRSRVAPTELISPRGYPVHGQVHDENAHALGGVAGHAGLFSTASDLAVFAQMMLDGGTYDGARIFADTTVALFTRRASGHRALGWDTADGDYGSGRYLTPRAYGHTGFTGTSMWIDPDRKMFVVLLTNRVHAARARHPGRVISDVRADLSDAAVLAVIDGPRGAMKMPTAFRADRRDGWNGDTQKVRAAKAAAARKRASARRARTRAAAARKRAPASSTRRKRTAGE